MVSVEKLSVHNMDKFKELNKRRFLKETYDKDFFQFYNNEKFFTKMILKKFVKLFTINGAVIGYIWYDVPLDIPIKIWSLYFDTDYLDYIDASTLDIFNRASLSYEATDNFKDNLVLTKLGFAKVTPSILMKLDLNAYNREKECEFLLNSLSHNTLLKPYIKNHKVNITFEKMKISIDEGIRCNIQNEIFSDKCRLPLEIADVENDIQQDYYIEDLSIFIKLNGSPIGYGQVIYTRNMYTVVNFGIIEEFRSLGFGKLLLDNLIKRCKDKQYNELYIRVEENNINAVKLYSWSGFKFKLVINKWQRY